MEDIFIRKTRNILPFLVNTGTHADIYHVNTHHAEITYAGITHTDISPTEIITAVIKFNHAVIPTFLRNDLYLQLLHISSIQW